MSAPSTTSSGSTCRSASSIAREPFCSGPTPGNELWAGFGGACENQNDGDPIVQYDLAANQWLISQFALFASDGFHQCIAISQTDDPTGAWYLYDFLISASQGQRLPALRRLAGRVLHVDQPVRRQYVRICRSRCRRLRARQDAGWPAGADGVLRHRRREPGLRRHAAVRLGQPHAASCRRPQPLRGTGRRCFRRGRDGPPELLGLPRRLGEPGEFDVRHRSASRASTRTRSRSTRTCAGSRRASRSLEPTRASTRSATG